MKQPAYGGLRALADRCGLQFGTCVSASPMRDDVRYARMVASNFNLITPENALKFATVSPSRHGYNFADSDFIIAFAKKNGMTVRGHVLVWHAQLPRWLQDGRFDAAELTEIMTGHIAMVVGRYAGRIGVWDVVNEAIAEDGSYRDNIWYRTIGRDYIDLAFHAARAADPNALLFYNDFGIEAGTEHSDAVHDLLSELLRRRVPVDGVGLQMHLDISQANRIDALISIVQRLSDLGLRVDVTELDVRMPIDRAPTQAQLQAQADVYRRVVGDCLDAAACEAIGLWGFTDRFSWIPHFWQGQGGALIFDEHYRRKPAYHALATELRERADETDKANRSLVQMDLSNERPSRTLPDAAQRIQRIRTGSEPRTGTFPVVRQRVGLPQAPALRISPSGRGYLRCRPVAGRVDEPLGKAFFVQVNQLGDLLCTTPAVCAFRRLHPNAFVTMIVPNSPHCRVLDGNPHIDLLVYRDDLRAHDLSIIDEQWICGLPVTVDEPSYLFRLRIEDLHRRPGVFDDHLSRGFGRLLGLETHSVRATVAVSDDERDIARSYCAGNYVVLSPHTSSPVTGQGGTMVMKDWLGERWLELARRLRERGDCDIVAIGSEADVPIRSRYFRNLYGLPIKVVAALLEQAACVVTVESGISHLCQAVDAPTVVIYAEQVPVAWGYPREASNCRVLIGDPRVLDCERVLRAVQTVLLQGKEQ